MDTNILSRQETRFSFSSKRIYCKNCQSSDGFAPLVDNSEYGHCFACGYKNYPKTSRSNTEYSNSKLNYKPNLKQEPVFIQKFLDNDFMYELPSVENSNFGIFFGKLLGDGFLYFLHQRGIRADCKGYTVFPFRNIAGKLTGVKSILYDTNGKRKKDDKFSIIAGYHKTTNETVYHSSKNGYELCLFNEYWINNQPSNYFDVDDMPAERKIYLVESEKTALIAEFCLSKYTCIATKGANCLTAKQASVFQNKSVWILPDNDQSGIEGAEKTARIIRTIPKAKVEISKKFLKITEPHEDLADLIIRKMVKYEG